VIRYKPLSFLQRHCHLGIICNQSCLNHHRDHITSDIITPTSTSARKLTSVAASPFRLILHLIRPLSNNSTPQRPTPAKCDTIGHPNHVPTHESSLALCFAPLHHAALSCNESLPRVACRHATDRYALLTSSITPRPVAMVSVRGNLDHSPMHPTHSATPPAMRLQQHEAATTIISALKPQHHLTAAYQHLDHPRHAFLQISTCTSGPQPVHNLAPFSYFNMMSHSPATVAIGITRSENKGRAYGKKDTLANIEETGHLVINSMNKW
jgi:hypothetical protein